MESAIQSADAFDETCLISDDCFELIQGEFDARCDAQGGSFRDFVIIPGEGESNPHWEMVCPSVCVSNLYTLFYTRINRIIVFINEGKCETRFSTYEGLMFWHLEA